MATLTVAEWVLVLEMEWVLVSATEWVLVSAMEWVLVSAMEWVLVSAMERAGAEWVVVKVVAERTRPRRLRTCLVVLPQPKSSLP
jgi:hypothetical protein